MQRDILGGMRNSSGAQEIVERLLSRKRGGGRRRRGGAGKLIEYELGLSIAAQETAQQAFERFVIAHVALRRATWRDNGIICHRVFYARCDVCRWR